MKTLLIIALLLSVAALGFSYQTPKVQQWEYKFDWKVNEDKANKYGQEGWELVTIDSKPMGAMGGAVSTYIFKRPKN